MSFRINTNVPSLQAQTSSKTITRETEKTLSKLSSGQRITKAADDASGLGISEKLKAGIRSSKQASRNANDGISIVQTAEGGLNETSSILVRMRELAIQAATDTLGQEDRANIDLEYEQMKSELERIAHTTQFNGRKLINGEGQKLDFQVGIGSHSSDDVISFNSNEVNADLTSLGVNQASIKSKTSAQNSLSSIDQAINKVSAHRSVLGSIQNRLTVSSSNLEVYHQNMSEANSRIRDVDVAEETANKARLDILSNANTAVLAQANTTGQNALKLIN